MLFLNGNLLLTLLLALLFLLLSLFLVLRNLLNHDPVQSSSVALPLSSRLPNFFLVVVSRARLRLSYLIVVSVLLRASATYGCLRASSTILVLGGLLALLSGLAAINLLWISWTDLSLLGTG